MGRGAKGLEEETWERMERKLRVGKHKKNKVKEKGKMIRKKQKKIRTTLHPSPMHLREEDLSILCQAEGPVGIIAKSHSYHHHPVCLCSSFSQWSLLLSLPFLSCP